MNRYMVLIFLLVGFVTAGNLLINADFEQDLSVGWQQSTLGIPYIITRNTALQGDPDYEVMVHKGSGSGYAMLYQTVDIPETDIGFACTAALYGYDNTIGDWAAAAVIISYMNASGTTLGETRICKYSDADCPWSDSPTIHLIVAADNNWHTYSFNIDEELNNLSGVNPLEVSKMQIALFDTSEWCAS